MNWNPRRFAFVFFAICVGLVFSGCGGGSTAPRLTHLTVAPTSASVVAGSTQQFTATGLFGDGTTQDETMAVTWTSSNSAVATIASGGTAMGVAAGTANITASLFGVSSNAAVLTVTPSSTLISIAVTPAFPTIAAGATQQFTATGTYTNASGPNTTQDITGQVTWAAVTPAAATINASGLATGVANGASVITAMLSGVTGQTTLTVGAATLVGLQVSPTAPTAATGTTVIFSVQELLSDNTTRPVPGGTTITWASDTPVNASIPANSRVAQALGVGTAVISATESGTACPGPAACTGSTTLTVVGAQARFAFIAATNALGFEAYSVNAITGVFTPNGTPGSTAYQQVLVHPSGHFLYTIDDSSSVEVFTVNSTTGIATATAFAPLSAGNAGVSKGVIDRTGHFLYVVSQLNNSPNPTDTLYGFTIDQTSGALTAMAGNPFTANLNNAQDVQIAHQSGAPNDYLYVINSGGNTVAGYSIDPTTGVPTALSTATFATGTGPYNSTVDPSGTHLYVPNSGDLTVSVYSIATTGLLTQVGTATPVTDGTTPAAFPYNVAVDPTDKYLYVVDNPSVSTVGAVYGFNIGTNGTVGTPVGPNVPAGKGPTGIIIDPTGVLVAVDNNGDLSITPYALGTGGVLTAYPIVTTNDSPEFLAFYIAAAGQ